MNRRSFLRNSAAASAGLLAVPALINGIPVVGFGKNSPFGNLSAVDNDRVLVVVQLAGGNDGLNTVIPLGDSLYASARPTIGITYPQDFTGNKPEGYVVLSGSGSGGTGLNGRMASKGPTKSFKSMYDEGHLLVVQGAGYQNFNRSHFRATDIWMSGSDAQSVLETGWFGRYLAKENPDFPNNIGATDDPLAVQIGYSLSRILYGPAGGMGITINSPDQFSRLVSGHPGQNGSTPPPATFGGDELTYVRQIVTESQQYAARIVQVAQNGTALGAPKVTYPADPRGFAAQLKIVAQLIAGGSKTKMYLVYISGFDTHAGQNGTGGQVDLLQYVSEGVAAFQEDLKALGADKRVIGMTFSEFGRRVNENGSNGTDHGTAAPVFLFGTSINGGIIGTNPKLAKSDLDANGDIKMQYDFRQIYASILDRWFGASQATMDDALNGATFASLNIINGNVGVDTTPPPTASDFMLDANYPNPFTATTSIGYSVNALRPITIKVFAENGREVATLVNAEHHYGTYQVLFDGTNLPAGTYLIRMQCESVVQSRAVQLVK
jgi:uncharacterized protein (DUF1501 family)